VDTLVVKVSSSLPLLLASLGAWNATPCHALEVDVGQGMVGRLEDVLHERADKVFATQWLDFKAPLSPRPSGLHALSLQVGVQQSSEITKDFLCRVTHGMVGEIYCSTREQELSSGPKFSAFYGGGSWEISETLAPQERPLRIKVGSGFAYMKYLGWPAHLVPYASAEIVYKLRKPLTAHGGVFLSMLEYPKTIGIALPAVSLKYVF